MKPVWIDDGTGPIRNPEMTDEEFDLALLELKSGNILALWQAAHDYEYSQISGSATAMLAVGLLQGKPKAVAVSNWIKSIWTSYYSRKPLVTHEYDETFYDFSSCGTIPHTVPELMAELG